MESMFYLAAIRFSGFNGFPCSAMHANEVCLETIFTIAETWPMVPESFYFIVISKVMKHCRAPGCVRLLLHFLKPIAHLSGEFAVGRSVVIGWVYDGR